MSDKDRIRDTVVYALLTAAEDEDYTRRELGEIHLLKYLYLADLAHAKWHEGQTFTGTEWTFHNFGPWSQPLHAAIIACLMSVGAEFRTFPSRFGDDDCKRWRIQFDENECRRVKDRLPLEVKQAMAAALQKHGNDTASLLGAVYATEPMLRTAPGAKIDLLPAEKVQNEPELEAFVPLMDKLTKGQRKRFDAKKQLVKARIAERLAQRVAPALVQPAPAAGCAEVLAWLDRMAGPQFPSTAEVMFGDDVWTSSARRGTSA